MQSKNDWDETDSARFSLARVIEGVCAVAKPIAQKKSIQIAIEVANELGEVHQADRHPRSTRIGGWLFASLGAESHKAHLENSRHRGRAFRFETRPDYPEECRPRRHRRGSRGAGSPGGQEK
jgi:hypothetical protein